jgi:hypothetical protein
VKRAAFFLPAFALLFPAYPSMSVGRMVGAAPRLSTPASTPTCPATIATLTCAPILSTLRARMLNAPRCARSSFRTRLRLAPLVIAMVLATARHAQPDAQCRMAVATKARRARDVKRAVVGVPTPSPAHN